MKITTVSACVRYLNGSKGGPYTAIELDAEAAFSPNEEGRKLRLRST